MIFAHETLLYAFLPLQIASVKSKIQSGHGHQASSQKIIYSGKILADTDTVQSCGVSEKDFLVLMVSKVSQYSLIKIADKIADTKSV